jgi:hypothetical protein
MRCSKTQYALIKHKDPTPHILSNSYVYSNSKGTTWVEYEFITNLNTILLIWCCYQTYPDQCLPSICSHVLNYSTCKWANWVFQALLKPSLVPKCDICYLKNKCCYTYSNSILVTLSHTHVIHFAWAILKLFRALIKHKDFINYIMPNLNLSQIILIFPS